MIILQLTQSILQPNSFIIQPQKLPLLFIDPILQNMELVLLVNKLDNNVLAICNSSSQLYFDVCLIKGVESIYEFVLLVLLDTTKQLLNQQQSPPLPDIFEIELSGSLVSHFLLPDHQFLLFFSQLFLEFQLVIHCIYLPHSLITIHLESLHHFIQQGLPLQKHLITFMTLLFYLFQFTLQLSLLLG